MVDPDPGYRPRRAFVEPTPAGDEQVAEPAPTAPDGDQPPTSAPNPPNTATSTSTKSAATASATTSPPAGSNGSSPSPAADAPAAPSDPDQPKPLYRDEVAGAAAGTTTPGTAVGSTPTSPSGDETRVVRPLNFRQRQRRNPDDEDATTLLPRTPAGGRRTSADAEDLDVDDEHRRSLLGRRGRLALLVGTMAAVIAVGIALIYAVSTVGNPTTSPTASAPADSGSAPGSVDPAVAALLGDEQLLTPAAAQQIDGDRTWKVALTQRPPAEDAPMAACASEEPAEGEPAAEQTVVQLLTSSGSKAPSALHRASAYATPEDAAQAYAVAAKTFGGCAAAGSYIVAGDSVTGLGDQAVGLVVDVIAGGTTSRHSVVLSRTGRVVDVVDAVQPDKALPVTGVAKALGAVVTTQCQPAGGECAASPAVKAAPPPLGGDVPGFLATGDVPPAGKADETWVATPTEPPSETFLGSQCETVTWSRLDAKTADSRVYLVPSSTKFGLNDIVLTMKSEKAATDLVAKIKADLNSCSKRKLTATVSDPAQVEGPGAQGSTVTGWTSTVSQKSTTGPQRYRVGIVSSGTKVAYTFLNPLPGGYDLTASEWDMVALRAGQRMTQVP